MATPPPPPPVPSLHPDPARIITPRRHGQILIEPPLPRLAALPPQFTDAPAPADDFTLLDLPRWAIAEHARAELCHAINTWAAAIGAPPLPPDADSQKFIITGHQVEFYHAGVWAKVLAADALARTTHSLAIDLLVDHDTLDHLGFDVPTQDPKSNHWLKKPIHWADPSNLPADSLSAPTPEQFAAWKSQLAQHPLTYSNTLQSFLTYLSPPSPQSAYVPWLSLARRQLESSLGLAVHHVPTSLLCEGNSWLLFVTAWIRNAPAWTAAYNAALADYRQAHDIHNPAHPMPDLAHHADTYELPFWLYRTGQPRSRMTIRLGAPDGREAELLYENERLPLQGLFQPSAWESTQSLRNLLAPPQPQSLSPFPSLRSPSPSPPLHIRPRALHPHHVHPPLPRRPLHPRHRRCPLRPNHRSTHLHPLPHHHPLRLRLRRRLLPLGQSQSNSQDAAPSLSQLRHRRHHLLHNPQQFINPLLAVRTDIAELILLRRNLLDQLQKSPSENRRAYRPERQRLFRQLHETNAALHAKSPDLLQKIDAQIASTLQIQQENKVLLREFFFALHAKDSLHSLIEKIRAM